MAVFKRKNANYTEHGWIFPHDDCGDDCVAYLARMRIELHAHEVQTGKFQTLFMDFASFCAI